MRRIYVKVYLVRWVSFLLDKLVKIKLNSYNPLFQLYSADDPQFSPEALYQKLKTETDPVSENFKWYLNKMPEG